MNDAVQHFHIGEPGRPPAGGGFIVNGDTVNGAGEAEADGWHEPGDAADGWHEPGAAAAEGAWSEQQWEEPQWDEPRKADSPAQGRSGERLTPGQLRGIVFRRAPLGKRGLDEHQVNSLLDRVEEELTRLTQERNALAGELELLRGYIADSASGALPQQQEPSGGAAATGAAPAAPAGPAARGSGLSRVEPAGAAESQAVAGRIHEAHVYAASLLSQAQQTADQYIKDAQRYSRELIEDARTRRRELLSQAGAEPGSPAEESWEREAVRLRATSREYRGKLRDYFELLLMNLDEWETAEGVGTPPPSNDPPH